jgi:dTDP-4-amino-4,6-dideoxygalactose transaminase
MTTTNHSLSAINDLRRHNAPLAGELTQAFGRLLASGWYVLGNEVREFEAAFAGYCGCLAAVGTANGTEALELSLMACEVGPGDGVALAANAGSYGTFAVNAIGARPVYVDVEAETMGLDPKALAENLDAHRVKAVILTHLYGRLARVEEIAGILAARDIKLIEDCAQAHGAGRGGRRAGSWGFVSSFSFYPTKNLGALGDGGAVVTNSAEAEARVRQLRQYGWDRKYRAQVQRGRNSRLDEFQAAVLSVKLPRLDGWNEQRAAIAERYRAAIKHEKVSLPHAADEGYVAHLYVIRTPERDSLAAHLRAAGVPFDFHYPIADHRQPMFGERFADVSLPVTEQLCEEVLTLPCFPEMTDSEVDWVAATVNRWEP